MGLALLLIFVGLPILEIALFIKVGGAIGLMPTLAVIVLTALAGTAIMRWQGLRALDRLRVAMETGQDPSAPIAHSALILVAGLLLVLPGFLTDALGALLLVPPVRTLLIRWGASRVTVRAAGYVRRPAAEVIEADYEVVEDPAPRGRGGRPSEWTQPH